MYTKPGPPRPHAWEVVARGAHERRWEKATQHIGSDGGIEWRTNAFVELASGLHHWREGAWRDSKETIQVAGDHAVALDGQHQLILAANLNSAGAIDLLAPDGKRMRSHILGLAYRDAATGEAVMIATIKDCQGALLPPNQAYYLDAFEGAFEGDFRADVRFTWRLGSFEQDIILTTAPPSPAAWGLNPEFSRLEVWTEFLEAEEPVTQTIVLVH